MADRRRRIHAGGSSYYEKLPRDDELVMGSNFDRLPDELLVSILDKLNWKDVAIISTASSRFHRIWESFMFKKILILEDNTYRSPSLVRFAKEILHIHSGSKFVEFVNQISHSHKGSRVDSLRIAFRDLYLFHDSFENWITFARTKCVQSLDITLGRSWWMSTNFYPQVHTFQGFHKLTSLSLKSVNISSEDLNNGVNNHLVNLESLCIEDAPTLGWILVKSLTLQQLEFRFCTNVLNINIVYAPNLKYLKTQECTVNFHFLQVPKLSEISCSGGDLCQRNLLALENADMLEKLELDLTPRCVHVECKMTNLPHFPLLNNLKQLELNFSVQMEGCIPLMIFSVILRACPDLHKLTLKYKITYNWYLLYSKKYWNNLKKDELRAISYKHGSLKEVEFIECRELCRDRECEILSVDYLLEIAPNLENITHNGRIICKDALMQQTKVMPEIRDSMCLADALIHSIIVTLFIWFAIIGSSVICLLIHKICSKLFLNML